MKWDPTLECGVTLVDNEHRELFKMVAELMHHSHKSDFKQLYENTLEFLGNYVVNHFAHEEELMNEINYPNLIEHAEAHAKFVATFLNLKDKFEKSSDSTKVALEIKHTAMGWLVNHIKVIDQRFTDYYKSAKQTES